MRGHAATAAHWWSAGNEHPQHDSPHWRLAEAGELLLGADEKIRRIRPRGQEEGPPNGLIPCVGMSRSSVGLAIAPLRGRH
jgi:hypothetical protein